MRELMLRYLGNDPLSENEMASLNAALLESSEQRRELLEIAWHHQCLHELLSPELASPQRRQPVILSVFYKIAAVIVVGLSVSLFFFLDRPEGNIAQMPEGRLEEVLFYPFNDFPLLVAGSPEISLSDVTEAPYTLGILNVHAHHVAKVFTPEAVLWAPDIQLH